VTLLSAFDPEVPLCFGDAAYMQTKGKEWRLFGGAPIVTSRALTRTLHASLGPYNDLIARGRYLPHDIVFTRLLNLHAVRPTRLAGLYSQSPGFYLFEPAGRAELEAAGRFALPASFHYTRGPYLTRLYAVARAAAAPSCGGAKALAVAAQSLRAARTVAIGVLGGVDDGAARSWAKTPLGRIAHELPLPNNVGLHDLGRPLKVLLNAVPPTVTYVEWGSLVPRPCTTLLLLPTHSPTSTHRYFLIVPQHVHVVATGLAHAAERRAVDVYTNTSGALVGIAMTRDALASLVEHSSRIENVKKLRAWVAKRSTVPGAAAAENLCPAVFDVACEALMTAAFMRKRKASDSRQAEIVHKLWEQTWV